jgi:hypothetical protein
MYFLGIFAGHWLPAKERSRLSCSFCFSDHFPKRYYLQAHFRCFARVDSMDDITGTDGLQCLRERGQIASDDPGEMSYFFKERRISVFGILSTGSSWDEGPTRLFYRVLILGEVGMNLSFGRSHPRDFAGCEGLDGTITFHIAMLMAIDSWETEWNNVLDAIDDRVRFSLEKDLRPNEMNKWMFDDNFDRSKLYFTILQVLRVFGGYICTVSTDLHRLDELFSKNVDTNFPLSRMRPDDICVLKENWIRVTEAHHRAEKRLLNRLTEKTEEVKSLRDGV